MMSKRRHYLSLATQFVALAGLLRVLVLAPSLQAAAPVAGPVPDSAQAHCGGAAQGQILYGSGAPVYYCSLPPMFAMLAAVEQPGVVRALFVRDAVPPAGAGWIAANLAVYVRQDGPDGGGPPSLAAFAQPHAARQYARASGGRLLSYQQLLSRSFQLAAPNGVGGLVTKG